ncbi:FAD-dependent oxidoreductase family protein [Quillaja saponaria]|uniref:FAD-dependent oxidoreductase family protein n=1 Tax=Quillaja saponaria TaxID=32244 RepID=A0AAD7QDS1_QUISA|nr:FAD-dependent oxidoreductase family protein [Quillaja saponaria]
MNNVMVPAGTNGRCPYLSPNSRMLLSHSRSPGLNVHYCGHHRRRLTTSPIRSSSSLPQRSIRYAVLGAGFAGLSVVWHLLKHSPKELHLGIDIYDEVGIGGGASGISGGLLHPYSPKAKLLWRGADCWRESIKLLRISEAAAGSKEWEKEIGESSENAERLIVRKRGILRLATNMKNLITLNENVRNCLASLKKHSSLACKNLAEEFTASGFGRKELSLHKKSVNKLLEFEGEYDAVIVCLGAKVNMLPEISGRLPLRTCRGVIAHLELPDDTGEGYPNHGPSILSEAWLAVQGPYNLHLGSTWEWKSKNSLSKVSADEASNALLELLPKASTIYPAIKDWVFTGARAGLRAMPPLTSYGSLPLLGCIDDVIGGTRTCKYWVFGGLGSRGLLYHGWLGKLMAQAVLCCNEEVIPSELTSWKRIMR